MSLVVGANSIAGLQIGPATSYRRTSRYFARMGRRGASSFGPGFCRLRFAKIGLFMTFSSLGAAGVGRPATCTFFANAVLTLPAWRTRNGLRVGASMRLLHRLFPKAFDAGKLSGRHWGIPLGSASWQLTQGSASGQARPILLAYVRMGHVAALGISIVGH